MKLDPHTLPVMIGIGEITEKLSGDSVPREPLELMRDAVLEAGADAGMALSDVDSLDVVMPMSWRYSDLAKQLSDALDINPAHANLGPSGGETPLKYIHQAAQRIADGKSEMAVVVGGEAQYSLTSLQRKGEQPPWTLFAMDGPNFADTGDAIDPVAVTHGLYMPVNVYGFFEAASAHKWGQTPSQAQDESAALWARYSDVAARNPYSWKSNQWTAAEVKTVTPKNRMIGGPYPKSMVANMNVNQSAAVLITSFAKAKAIGISEDKCVFITAGGGANEPRNFLKRDQYSVCHAQDVVLENLRNSDNDLGGLELYSCFPCVPKMARRTLGLGEDFTPTVTGGLSFFGAPLNNYMTHASCAMVRALRDGAHSEGTLYGQGEFMTKHYGLRLSRRPASLMSFKNLQAKAEARLAPIPELFSDYSGPATVETFTMMYGRDGSPTHGVVIGRTHDGSRALASLPATDADGLAVLLSNSNYPIGRRGDIEHPDKGAPIWHFS